MSFAMSDRQNEYPPGLEGDNIPRVRGAAEPTGKSDPLVRELILLSVLFFAIILAAWALVSGKLNDKPESEPHTPSLLRQARAQLNDDLLTRPPTRNALETYLYAQDMSLGSSAIESGLQSVSQRYLELIDNLIKNRDLALAAETLEAAQKVVPHASRDYASALAAARVQLEQAAQQVAAMRESARSTADSYTPLTAFQDFLSDGSMGPRLIVIPAGQYLIGSPVDEPGRDSDEGPQRAVSLSKFAISETEVTFAEFARFSQAMGWELPDDGGWGRGTRPVMNVSWLEAKAYTSWLSEQTGFRYRLPTEAEWEYAARAGTSTPYSSGACPAPEHANVDFRAGVEHCPGGPAGLGKTVPVGTGKPNPWGLYNVHGNLREWVQDCWKLAYDPTIIDGRAYFSGEGGSCGASGERVIRGGDWLSATRIARSANRSAVPEHEWQNTIGFRVVREID